MLIGRGAERDRLRRSLDAAQRGRADALLLHGEPGIGKTALLEDTAAHAEKRGFGFLRARGLESESSLPYAGLSELLAPILSHRDALPAVQEHALAGALALEGGEPPDRFAVAAAVLGLFDAAADARPLLVLMDDIQWLDDASRDALLFAARRLQAENVVLLLASRDGVGFDPTATGLETLPVGPLPAAEAEQLLHERHPGIAPSVARKLLDTAQGNPLALAELPSLLTADQLAGRTPT
jgi:predicted ATPase